MLKCQQSNVQFLEQNSFVQPKLLNLGWSILDRRC